MAQVNHTVITDYRRELLCKITSGAIAALPPISHIAFGDGGTGEDGQPLDPLGTQTALNHEVGRYPLDHAAEYPIPTTARYAVTIPKHDLPGVNISEAALLDVDGGYAPSATCFPKARTETWSSSLPLTTNFKGA